ncbi:hypothetical protein AT728_27645 [Streptomyces silvensis]|uniref:Uncharacterized protein n=1 Tax=Streptomyces silvensis TaxID=1765722 RepID=A0A0W7XAL6_9ACTN|nr:hypothetical protein AT728_27645 [Streptomyces silvensis]
MLFSHLASFRAGEGLFGAVQAVLTGGEQRPCPADRLVRPLSAARDHLTCLPRLLVRADLTFVQGAFALIGGGFPGVCAAFTFIGGILACVSGTLALVCQALAFLSELQGLGWPVEAPGCVRRGTAVRCVSAHVMQYAPHPDRR